jgi:putative FmdB family regulatory protein
MPIYEYRRPDGTTFEVMQRMAEDALTHDPETGVPVERVFHPVAVHFKGKGFYNTDYGTKRRNRELRESAESGADRYEAGQAEKRKEARDARDAKSSSSSSGDSRPAKASGDGKRPAARKPAKKS